MFRILFAIVFLVGLAGCATTQSKTQTDQLQSRVTDLEKKVEEKDAEIVDLQYQVKDLSSKVDGNSQTLASSSESKETAASPVVPAPTGGFDIIKTNTTPEKLQTALKNAGFYEGKVDGKIGAGTKAAVVAFQKSKGLKADGVVGRKTWDALKQYLK